MFFSSPLFNPSSYCHGGRGRGEVRGSILTLNIT
jgi:hypothetical protein